MRCFVNWSPKLDPWYQNKSTPNFQKQAVAISKTGGMPGKRVGENISLQKLKRTEMREDGTEL